MKYNLGVALSGGGYRAAAFHLGTIRFLHKAGILNRIDVLSTVSGGSIIGAAYCLSESQSFEQFENDFKSNLQKSIIRKVLLSSSFIILAALILITIAAMAFFIFCTSHAWVAIVIEIMGISLLIKYQFKIFPVSKIIERIYDDMFYKKQMLPSLATKPVLVINSTNLQTGRLFYFTRDYISDSTYDNTYDGGRKTIFYHQNFSIAKAVMCSSCVPSFFTPIEIKKELFIDSKTTNIKPILVDGGVYDNQGIHKLTHSEGQFECKTVIVSDAGILLPFKGAYNNILTLLLRTVEVFMNRIKMFQMMTNLYQNKTDARREIAYITLGWDIDGLISGFVKNLRNGNVIKQIRDAHQLTDELVETKTNQEILDHMAARIGFNEIAKRLPSSEQINIARSVSTNLTALSSAQIEALSAYAEVMTEVQVKLYCPSLIN